MGKKGKTSKNNVIASKNKETKPTPQATPNSTPYLTEDETLSRRPPPQQGFNGSMSSHSKMKIPPSLAAALLSFPWPPPEKSKLALARLKEDMSKAETGNGRNDSNGNTSNTEHQGAGKVASESQKAKASTSRKFYRKKSCCCCHPGQKEERNVVINGDPHRKPGEPFLPVTVPPFTHVHTAWPGFDHAPVSNWKNKYLIAKPYPYHQRKWERTANDINNSNAVFSRPSELDILDRTWRNQTGRSLASAGGQASSTRMSRMNKFDGLTSDDDKACVCSTATTVLHNRSVVRPGGGCCMRK